MRVALVALAMLAAFALGRAGAQSGDAQSVTRRVVTVHIGAVYGIGPSCPYNKAKLPVWEDIHGCVLSSFASLRRPVEMDFMWRGGTSPWFSATAGTPSGLVPVGLKSVHLQWSNGKVVLYMISGEHLTGISDVQYEAVYSG